MVLKDGVAYVQAGAGIVADSDAKMEDLETRNKAGARLTDQSHVVDENRVDSGGMQRQQHLGDAVRIVDGDRSGKPGV